MGIRRQRRRKEKIQICHIRKRLDFIFTVFLFLTSHSIKVIIVKAAPASPFRFQNPQPDGTLTIDLQISGTAGKHMVTDAEGYNVIEDESGFWVYAKKDYVTGKLVSAGIRAEPFSKTEKQYLSEKEIEPSESLIPECGNFCDGKTNNNLNKKPSKLMESEKLSVGGMTIMNGGSGRHRKLNRRKRILESSSILQKGLLRNLVILMRFRDHRDRELPTLENLQVLFNLNSDKNEASPIAPTGSVRDVFLTSSYGKFDLESTVIGWVDLPETEAYYANGKSGITSKFQEAVVFSLEVLDNLPAFQSELFDKDKDSVLDSVMFLHSGYGAEWGKTDCEMQTFKNRIWSHTQNLDKAWINKNGFKVNGYSTSSALWNTCGAQITRIGNISHELGNLLGLPVLDSEGSGVGSYGLMGNSWGIDGSQLQPPILSAWSKIAMGWVSPTAVESSGRYTLDPIATNAQVIKISKGFPSDEYLLIENRQPTGFDTLLQMGGLLIYHIDDKSTFNNPGYPGQIGWPENGKHYRVAIMQSDKMYHLEKGENNGDGTDLFITGDEIGPGGTSYPNTDSYQNGIILQTGVRIYDITRDGDVVSFSINVGESDSPSLAPFAYPKSFLPQNELVTTFKGKLGSTGVMFDVVAGLNSIKILSLDIDVKGTAYKSRLKVYTKKGTHQKFEAMAPAWQLVCDTQIKTRAFFAKTIIDERHFEPVSIKTNETQAFYVVIESGDLRYSRGKKVGVVAASNSDLQLLDGVGVNELFGKIYSPRTFNGRVIYNVIDSPKDDLSPQIQREDTGEKIYELATTYQDDNGHDGIMFTIRADGTSIIVIGMDLHVEPKDSIPIEIYTKIGIYQGFERDPKAWNLVCKTEVDGKGLHIPTTVNPRDFSSVEIKKNRLQSFYVTSINGRALRYSSAMISTVNDGTMSIYLDGTGLAYPFGSKKERKMYSPRMFNGSIRYITNIKKTDLQNRKEDVKELFTTFSGEVGSYGIMFDVVAKRDLYLQNVDFFTRKAEKLKVTLYTKAGSFLEHSKTLDTWEELCTTYVVRTESFKRRSFPDNCFPPVSISRGAVQSLYLTASTPDIRYSIEKEKKPSSLLIANDDIEVKVGAGIGGYPLELSTMWRPNRNFNGAIKYFVK